MSPELSVVIPALNEAAALPALLAQLRAQEQVALEVIVADGGSTDATAQLASEAGAKVVRAPRGRGAQMNAAAREAQAPLLLFLHADSAFTVPLQLRRAVDALKAAGAQAAGHFPLHFLRSLPGNDFFYRTLQAKTALVPPRPHTINGDQGLMLPAEFFRALGGYDESLAFLEDQRIAAKIFARGRWVTFDTPLATSARRFESEGAQRRYALMALIMGLHAAQADEWFAAAPKVYASQDQAGPLDVSAYLALTWRVLMAAGPRRAAQILWRAGRFTRQNSWQPFLWLDVALSLERRPCLRFHDALFGPVTNNVAGDALATLLMTGWFLFVLPPAYWLLDRIR
jgi:rSAM/selenodomain-associated transferase 2